MKRNFVVVLAIAAVTVLMAGALVACGGSSGSASASGSAASSAEPAAELTEFDFYSVAIPEGYEASSTKNVFKPTSGSGSIYVSVDNVSADDLLAAELQDSDFAQGDDVTAGGKTYKVATSDKWNYTYYITDWEDGSIEVLVKELDDADAVEAFLGSLQPAEDAYAKWQAADK